jgi:hypothetical protein
MSFGVLLVVHALPLWFLVFSLFLPRIALLLLWLEGPLAAFHLHGLLPLIVAILLPRILILYLIYGSGHWPVVHHPSGRCADGLGRVRQLPLAPLPQ